MLLDHKKFDYQGKCLIEKVVVKAPFRFSVDFHDEACFIHFFEGEAKINSPYEQVPVKAEDSVLLRCGTYFADLVKYSSAERYEILVFHLSPGLLRSIYRDEMPDFVRQHSQQQFIKKLASQDVVHKFAESLYFYFEHPELVNDELLALKVKELILLLIQTKSADSILGLFAQLFSPREVSIKEVVSGHVFSDLSIEDLARLSGLSVSTFNRTFHLHFKDSPANYIKKKRLERAKELLTMSSMTISEIAYETRFADVAHFSRSFKAAHEVSPKEFRASLKVK